MTGWRRSAVARLMAWVAVVAANLAAARALPEDENRALLAGVAPMGLALQAGLFLAIRRRGRLRAFWLGFVACALGSLATFAFATIRVPQVKYRSQPGGRLLIFSGPPWNGYHHLAFDSLNDWLMGLGVRQGTDRLFVAEVVIYSLPQLLIGLAGGVAGLLLRWAWLRSIRPGSSLPGAAPPG